MRMRKEFDYTVRVRAKTGTIENYKDFSGYRSFLRKYRLNN